MKKSVACLLFSAPIALGCGTEYFPFPAEGTDGGSPSDMKNEVIFPAPDVPVNDGCPKKISDEIITNTCEMANNNTSMNCNYVYTISIPDEQWNTLSKPKVKLDFLQKNYNLIYAYNSNQLEMMPKTCLSKYDYVNIRVNGVDSIKISGKSLGEQTFSAIVDLSEKRSFKLEINLQSSCRSTPGGGCEKGNWRLENLYYSPTED